MKRFFFILLSLSFIGCTYEGQSLRDYIEDPKTLIKDPHYAEYQQERDNLESMFLQKKISYADYIEQMDDLDDQYTKEVQERNSKLSQ